MRETIFALSSGVGRAAVALVRLSGPRSGQALMALAGGALPSPRQAVVRRLRRPGDQAPLDEALVLWFPGPRSFTGEDLVELHLHGGQAVVSAVLSALAAMDGLRPAEAGEFTRRAFDAGRLDLTEVEGLADLIAAESEQQRLQALAQMRGALSRKVALWRDALIRAVAYLEAEIDFSEEELPETMGEEARILLRNLAQEVREALDLAPLAERLRDGLEIAIVGPPNAGKSSLLNALARREAAIVSSKAGTTRDVIEVQMDLAGFPVTFADTAGLRDLADQAVDEVEAEGIRRSLARAQVADLRLLVLEAGEWRNFAAELGQFAEGEAIAILSKSDLFEGDLPAEVAGLTAIGVSARSGEGMAALLDALKVRLAARFARLQGGASFNRARQEGLLRDLLEGLERALSAPLADMAAEDARLALRSLGRLVGEVDVEDLLDVIFRDFCIGK